jgi:hypothetical protein
MDAVHNIHWWKDWNLKKLFNFNEWKQQKHLRNFFTYIFYALQIAKMEIHFSSLSVATWPNISHILMCHYAIQELLNQWLSLCFIHNIWFCKGGTEGQISMKHTYVNSSGRETTNVQNWKCDNHHTWANSYLIKYSSLHMSHHPHMDTRLRQCVTSVSKIMAMRKSKTLSLLWTHCETVRARRQANLTSARIICDLKLTVQR